MAEIRTVTTLTTKRDAIAHSIVNYERKLGQAKADLAHINAVLAIFKGGDPTEHRVYVDLERIFRYGEMAALALGALAGGGELSTRDITSRVIAAKGLDAGDLVLGKTICQSLVQSLRGLAKRRKVKCLGKRQGVCVWSANPC